MRLLSLAVLCGLIALPAVAQVDYSISDGVADLTLSIDPGESIVFLNTFPVDSLGGYIDQIRVAYGRVGGPSALDGQPVTLLVYQDVNGGSPQDAQLLWWRDTMMRNGNTDILNETPVPLVRVVGTLVVGFLYENMNPFPVFVGALDTTPPIELLRSWSGYDLSIDPADLGAIPATQWGAQEDFFAAGNFRIGARGRATDGIDLTVEPLPGLVRLSWTGNLASYTVERAMLADFSDVQQLATGVTEATFDDPDDGQSWFYRVR